MLSIFFQNTFSPWNESDENNCHLQITKFRISHRCVADCEKYVLQKKLQGTIILRMDFFWIKFDVSTKLKREKLHQDVDIEKSLILNKLVSVQISYKLISDKEFFITIKLKNRF
jgi:hypothetical protein